MVYSITAHFQLFTHSVFWFAKIGGSQHKQVSCLLRCFFELAVRILLLMLVLAVSLCAGITVAYTENIISNTGSLTTVRSAIWQFPQGVGNSIWPGADLLFYHCCLAIWQFPQGVGNDIWPCPDLLSNHCCLAIWQFSRGVGNGVRPRGHRPASGVRFEYCGLQQRKSKA